MVFDSIESAEDFMSNSKTATARELLEAATYLNIERIKLNLKEMESVEAALRVLQDRNKEYARQTRLLNECRMTIARDAWCNDAARELHEYRKHAETTGEAVI